MKLRIVITGRNHEAFVEENLSSLLPQLEDDWTIHWIDDCSDTDAPELAALGMLGMEHRVIKSMVRQGGLANFRRGILAADDDDVVFLMGGDGDTVSPGSLARMMKLYEDPECWMTYGSFGNSDESVTHKFYPWDGTELRAELRDFLFMPITFRAWLGKKVCEKDLKIAGYFFQSSGDIALNLPIAEMAGPEHARFIEERWYTRKCHPDNDTRVDALHQYYSSFKAMGKPRYSRLSSRDDVPTRTHHQLKYGLMCHPDGRGNITMPQAVAYGDELPVVGHRTQVYTLDDLPDWVANVVKRSLACAECKGKKECTCAADACEECGKAPLAITLASQPVEIGGDHRSTCSKFELP